MSNLKEVLNRMKKDVKNSLENDFAPESIKVVKNQIDDDVYSHTQKEYDRTYELKDSVINTNAVISGNQIEIEIKHDTDLINANSPNQHMSVVDGSDISASIPYIINEGKAGKIFGEGFWTEPRPYMDNVKEKIKSTKLHTKELKKSLINKGYKVD